MIWLAIAMAVGALWCAFALAASLAPAPSIDQFESRAELQSDLVSSVALRDVADAASSMPGIRAVCTTDSSILLSMSPRMASLHRGTGAWVRMTRGPQQYLVEIRGKTPLHLTSFSHAVVEFERDLRMMLRRRGVVRFDIRESAAVLRAVPPTSTAEHAPAPPPATPPPPPRQWWKVQS